MHYTNTTNNAEHIMDYLNFNITHSVTTTLDSYVDVPVKFAANARILDFTCDAILADGTVCNRTAHAGGHKVTKNGKSFGAALYIACAACNMDDNLASTEVTDALVRNTADGADARAELVKTMGTADARKVAAATHGVSLRSTGAVPVADFLKVADTMR